MTIPVYLINLDRSPERLSQMESRFAEIGVSFERVKAVDGKDLSADEINAVRLVVPGWLPLSAGEVGCYLSHRRCWQLISNREDPYGCIFEDDVLLSPQLQKLLSDVQWIPKIAHVVKLETSGIKVWLDAAHIDLGGGLQLSRLRSVHYRAGGYILSREAAISLLSQTQCFSVPVDLDLFDPAYGLANKMITYQCLPSVCAQTKQLFAPGSADHVETTIEERGNFEREGEWARLGRKARREGQNFWHRIRRRRRAVVEFWSY